VNIRTWRVALFALFAVNGIGAATWASRTPAIAEGLGIGVAQMAALITALPVGGIFAILASSHIIHFLGPRRAARIALLVSALGLTMVGVTAGLLGNYPLAFCTFLVYGFANATSGIVINVQAAELDRMGERTRLPMFHGTFSIGMSVGAGTAALAVLAHIPIAVHFAVAALLLVAAAIFAARHLTAGESLERDEPSTFRTRMGVWLEPRTLLIGVIVLGAAFTEGTANNWLALAMVQDRALTPAAAAGYLTVFTAAMTVGRFTGGSLTDRFGRVAVIRWSLVLAGVGVVCVVFTATPWASITGVVVWGLGASVGYPLGISAAADNPVNAAARVSAVAAVGSIAFLIGPSIIGLIGEQTTLLLAFTVVIGLIALSLAASRAAYPPAGLAESRVEHAEAGLDLGAL